MARTLGAPLGLWLQARPQRSGWGVVTQLLLEPSHLKGLAIKTGTHASISQEVFNSTTSVPSQCSHAMACRPKAHWTGPGSHLTVRNCSPLAREPPLLSRDAPPHPEEAGERQVSQGIGRPLRPGSASVGEEAKFAEPRVWATNLGG